MPVSGSDTGLERGETPDAAHGRAAEEQGAIGKGAPGHGSAGQKKAVAGNQTPDGGHAKAKEKKAHGGDDGGQKPQEKQP